MTPSRLAPRKLSLPAFTYILLPCSGKFFKHQLKTSDSLSLPQVTWRNHKKLSNGASSP